LEQVVLSNEAISRGFRIENGHVVKYVLVNGVPTRKRKNWKNSIRQESRQYILDNCENCNSKNHLTIHHIISLDKGGQATKDNCMTLCDECHRQIHGIIKRVKHKGFIKGRWGEYRIK
jgi:5-methylcytosine-specific restriction endonuclease McrA